MMYRAAAGPMPHASIHSLVLSARNNATGSSPPTVSASLVVIKYARGGTAVASAFVIDGSIFPLGAPFRIRIVSPCASHVGVAASRQKFPHPLIV